MIAYLATQISLYATYKKQDDYIEYLRCEHDINYPYNCLINGKL